MATIRRAVYRLGHRLGVGMPKLGHLLLRSPHLPTPPFRGRWGTNQYVHPDLVWTGRTFVLTATAYPFASDLFEVPELFSSADGRDWRPEFRAPSLGREKRHCHYSDPDILALEEGPILYFRKCGRDTPHARPERPDREWILAIDARSAGSARVVLEDRSRSLLSPASCRLPSGKFLMICVDDSVPERRLRRFVAEDPMAYSETAPAIFDGGKPWHLDIAIIDQRLIACVLVEDHGERHFTRLILAESGDEGGTWRKLCELPYTQREDVARMYRSSICDAPDGPVIALSMEMDDRAWGMELRPLERAGDGYRIGKDLWPDSRELDRRTEEQHAD